ncbi:hypothetical protein MHU86_1898 [Fragilaria crotonensis]|nr:hypothetical protein MHU86_1898 [Fragilaria crotonensis]
MTRIITPIALLLCLPSKIQPVDTDLNCTLCSDGSIPNNPNGRSRFGDETITCQEAYDLGPILLPEDNCTFFQDIGTKICYCGVELPTNNYSCPLCEDGTALPDGLLEAFPGETCAEMQVDAKRDSAITNSSSTNQSRCVYYQGVVGTTVVATIQCPPRMSVAFVVMAWICQTLNKKYQKRHLRRHCRRA